MQYLGAISKMAEWFVSRQTIQHHSNPNLIQSPNLWCQRSWNWMVLWRPTRPSIYVLFILGDWNVKVGRNTWNNRQIWPWSTKWSRARANIVLPRECTGHSKHPVPTTQKKTLHMDITRRSIPKSDSLYSLQPKMEKLYTVSKNKTRSWLWLRSWASYCQIQT